MIVACSGLFLGGRAVYPRIRNDRAAERRRQNEVRERADEQHRWASRGDTRGVYGTAGAELMREVIPPPSLPPASAPRPPPEDIEVAEVAYTQAELDAMLTKKPQCWDYHDRLLALSERCRSVTVPHSYAELQRDTGLLMVIPLEGYTTFIDDFVGRVAEMHDVARYASGDVQLDPVMLSITDDDELISRVGRQISQAAREG
jgi:hypothetical protein